jgi:hypothetical protein
MKRLKSTKRSTRATVTVLLVVFSTLSALALGGALTIGSAFGAPLAPAPKISSAPPAATASKGARFTFSHARPHVSFLCKLDAGPFVSCAGRKSYAQLGSGKHTFRVRAAEGTKRSRIASFSWTIDRTPPAAPRIVSGPPSPATGTTTTTEATFRFTGERGATFLCGLNSTAAAGFSLCKSAKVYTGVAEGLNTFYVKARDSAGNLSTAASHQWLVDTVASALPTAPRPPGTQESGPPSGPRPSVPDSSAVPVGPGPPIPGPSASEGPGEDFTISGDAAGPIYPNGPAQPILVTLHNPNGVPIVITDLVVSANADAPGGCRADALVIQQADFATATVWANGIAVPAGGDVTLPAQGVAPPTIRIVDTNENQTADCAGQTFRLTYTGSAHS